MKRFFTICLVAIFCASTGFAKQEPITEYINIKGTLNKTTDRLLKGQPSI